jgi:hypothetical protein
MLMSYNTDNFDQQEGGEEWNIRYGDESNDSEILLDSSPSQDSSMQYESQSHQSNNEDQTSAIFGYDINALMTDPYHSTHINWLNHYREHPKEFADLNDMKNAGSIKTMLDWINKPEVRRILLYLGYEEYDNEMEEGVYIQHASKEFKQNHGFDEANFPFDNKGGPQKKKLPQFGFIYKYWYGKQDPSYKMRKFYMEDGLAIFVVFREESINTNSASSNYSPGSSSDDTIKQDPSPPNKKRRREDQATFSGYSSDSASGHMNGQYETYNTSDSNNHTTNNTNATTVINAQQMVQNNVIQNNNNYSAHYPSYVQPSSTIPGVNDANMNSDPPPDPQPTQQAVNNNNNVINPHQEHYNNQIGVLSTSVEGLTKRVSNLELSATHNVATKTRSLDEKQRQICRFIIQVFRESGNRLPKGKPLATKVRQLAGGKLDKKVVNNLLYTVLEALGIIQLQDDEWVLIDEEKAKQFEQ